MRILAWIRHLPPRFWLGLVAAGAGAIAVAAIAFTVMVLRLPTIRTLEDYAPPQTTRIYSDDGFLIGQLFREKRTVVPVDAIPQHVIHAFLAAEDASFFEHQGLDYMGILRAALKNLRVGARRQGASTITQQTVKTMIVGPERSYTRKLKEAILARRLESRLSKDEILHLYLNQIYFGTGNYGVEAASQAYFGISVRQVDVAQAAYLAAIPKSPARYNLKNDPQAAKERQRYVLGRMLENGWIDAQTAQTAMQTPPPLVPAPPPYLGKAPHYVEHVRRLLEDRFADRDVYEGGLAVYTGAKAASQTAAHTALRRGLENYTKRHGYKGPSGRIEVDQLRTTLPLLKEALAEQRERWLERHPSVAASHNPNPQAEPQTVVPQADGEPKTVDSNNTPIFVWDLAKLADELPHSATTARSLIKAKPLHHARRVTALVTRIDSVGKKAYVDLGDAEGQLRLRDMRWARPFSPSEPTPVPRDPSDILQRGDLVVVDVFHHGTDIKTTLVPIPGVQGALVAIDPHTRYVHAVVGGYDLKGTGLNRATQSLRQPGSAFKPIVYAAALNERMITAADICADTPVVIRDPWTGKAWKPENYEDGRYDGNITYRTALMRSKNTCSVKLIRQMGHDKVANMAQALGITATMPPNLTMALGTGEVTPAQLANAYATLASGGYQEAPVFIRKVAGPDGAVWFKHDVIPQRALDPQVNFVLVDMMRSVIEQGTGRRARSLGRTLAGKTGTSNDSRDLWFSGFSPELAVTVWVGFDDNRDQGRSTGGAAALPIWIDYVGEVLKSYPKRDFPRPDGIVTVNVDPETGRPRDGSGTVPEIFIEGTQPSMALDAERGSIFEIDDEALTPMPGGTISP